MFIIKNNTNKLLEEYEEIFDNFLYNLNKDFINFKYEQGNDVLCVYDWLENYIEYVYVDNILNMTQQELYEQIEYEDEDEDEQFEDEDEQFEDEDEQFEDEEKEEVFLFSSL